MKKNIKEETTSENLEDLLTDPPYSKQKNVQYKVVGHISLKL